MSMKRHVQEETEGGVQDQENNIRGSLRSFFFFRIILLSYNEKETYYNDKI